MKKGTTINKAIIQVLKEVGKPLRVSEIYQQILEDDLYRFRAINPEHIVRTQLRRHSINLDFTTAAKSKHFVQLSDGRYWLKNVPHKNIDRTEQKVISKEIADQSEIRKLQSKHTKTFKQNLIKQLQQLDPYVFEHFCRKLLLEYGFKNIVVTQKSRDGGIDGYGELKIGLAILPVAFECKKWKTTVGRAKVSQFRGDIQGKYQQGIFFATSSFSKDAKNVSFQAGAVPIILIDGMGIIELMIQKEFGIEVKNIPVYYDALDTVVPKLDSESN